MTELEIEYQSRVDEFIRVLVCNIYHRELFSVVTNTIFLSYSFILNIVWHSSIIK